MSGGDASRPEYYWTALGTAIGAGIGTAIGLAGWGADGIAYGAGLGAGIGVALGTSRDALLRRRRPRETDRGAGEPQHGDGDSR